MSDLVINVRQIGNYPNLPASDGSEHLLVQLGGIGGPYNNIATSALVQTALQNSSIGLGQAVPGDASAGQVFTDAIAFPPDGWIGLNFYDGANQGRYRGNGPAAQIGFTLDQPQGITIALWPPGNAGAPVDPAKQIVAFQLTTAGDLTLPNGTLTVARNPGSPMEVATASYVGATTVASFNARRGTVQLNQGDVNQALGVCPPDFIATDSSVQQRLQELLAGHPFVWSFNGRVGNIWLRDSDVAQAYFAPGACPVAPTPPANSKDFRIPNTEWINQTLYGRDTNSLWDRLLKSFAPINSPIFTGKPQAPEPDTASNDEQLATTKWVRDHQTSSVSGVASFNLRTGAVTLTQTDITNAGGLTQAQAQAQFLPTSGGNLTGNLTQGGSSAVISTAGAVYAQRFWLTNNQGATQAANWTQAGADASQLQLGTATGTLSNITLIAPATSAHPLYWATVQGGSNRRWRMQSTGAEQATDNGSGSSFSLAYAIGTFGSWAPVFTVTRNPSITFSVPTSVPTPTINAHAATKAYVDTAPFVPIAGGTVLGAISWAGTPTDPSNLATKAYVDATTSQLTTFLGTYNAATNTPNLVGLVPNNGQYWIVAVAGTPPPAVPGVGGVAVGSGDMLIWDEASGGYVRIASGGITQAQADARYLQLTGGTVINTAPGQQTLLTVANSGNPARILLASISPVAGIVSTMLSLSNNNDRAWGIWPGDNQTTLWLGPVAVGGLIPANINQGSLGITDQGATIPSNGTLALGGGANLTMGSASVMTLGGGSSVNFGNLSSVTLGGDPTLPLQAATKSYVDTHVPDLSGYLPLTGGTINAPTGTANNALTINAAEFGPIAGGGSNLFLDSVNHRGTIYFPTSTAGRSYYVGNVGQTLTLGHFQTTDFGAISYSASSGALALNSTRPGGAGTNSGFITFSTLATTGAGTGNTGNVTVNSGSVAGSVTTGNSGNVQLFSGALSTGPAGGSGNITINSGNVVAANQTAGSITIRTGNATNGATAGAIYLQLGNPAAISFIDLTPNFGIRLGPSGAVPIVLGRAPLADMEAATKLYVDQAIVAADQGFLRLTGGTMTGPLQVLPPVNPADATDKAYVDAELASLSLFVSTWQVAANVPPLTGATETDGDYYIAVTATPTVPETAPIGTPGIAGQLINNGDMIIWSAANAVYQVIRGGPLNVAEANALFVQKIGDTMSGPLTINGTLTMGNGISLGAANASPALNLARHLILHTAGIGLNASASLGGGIRYIATSGLAHTFYIGGASVFSIVSTDIYANLPVSLVRDPQYDVEAATKRYVDTSGANNLAAMQAQLANYLPLTGGRLTGNLTINPGSLRVGQGGAVNNSIFMNAGSTPASFCTIQPSATGSAGLRISIPNNAVLDLQSAVVQIGTTTSARAVFNIGTSPALCDLDFGATTVKRVRFFGGATVTAENLRWVLRTTTSDNAFVLSAYDNTGVNGIDTLSVDRTSGLLTLVADPVNSLHAATKAYVDNAVAGGPFLPLAGGTLSGTLALGSSAGFTIAGGGFTVNSPSIIQCDFNRGTTSAPISLRLRSQGVDRWIMQVQQTAAADFSITRHNDAGALQGYALTISRTTGLATVTGDPTTAMGIATKQYVDNHVPDLSGYLPTSGGTVTGAINWVGPPTADTNLVTKSYVDTAVAAASQFQGTWDVVNNVPDLTAVTPLNGQYWIASSTGTAPAGVPGIGGRNVTAGDTVIWETSLNGFQVISAGGITLPEADARYLQLTGGTLSGALTLAGDASANLQPVTLQQVNTALAQKLNVAGGTMTGFLTLNADPTNPLQAATMQYVDARFNAATAGGPFLPTAGGTLSGQLTMQAGINFGAASAGGPTLTRHLTLYDPGYGINVSTSAGGAMRYVVPAGSQHQFYFGASAYITFSATTAEFGGVAVYSTPAPTVPNQLANKGYVDAGISNLSGQLANYLPLAGGQMSGVIQMLPPVNSNDGATKGYVDAEIASLSVFVSTWQVAANLPPLTGAGEGDGDYYIAVTANPNVPEAAPATVPGLGGRSIDNGDMVIWSAGTGTYQLIRGGPLNVAEANSLFVQRTGSTMTGPLVLSQDAVAPLGAVTLNQLTATVANYLPLSGGTLSGTLRVPATGISYGGGNLIGFSWTGSQLSASVDGSGTPGTLLPTSGGTLTGALFLPANATAPLQATTLQQMQAADATKLNLSGGVLTGSLTLAGDPTTALGAATRQYVDSRVPNLSGYLPLTGGTISGNLQIGAGNPQGFPFYVNGSALIAATVVSTNFLAEAASPAAATFAAINPASQTGAGFWYDATGPVLRLGSTQANGLANTPWLSATPTVVTTLGNLGIGTTPPANAAPPNSAYGGGWVFSWGVTTQNLAGNMYWDGTVWRRLNASIGILVSIGGNAFSVDYSPAGTTGTPTVNQRLLIANTNSFTVNTPAYFNPGRVIAQSPSAYNPAFCVYDTSQSAASAMWEGGNGTLQFGDADGLGNPLTMRMEIDRASNMYIGGTLSQGSDARLKRDVRDETRGLRTLAQLRPRSFMRHEGKRRELGFVAQELRRVLPEAVGEVMLDGTATLTVAPMMLLTVLVNSVNELAARMPRRRRGRR